MIDSQIQQQKAINAVNSPVFIVGCDRSGTTLLRLMLNQSPVLYISPETEFLIPLKDNQELYGDFSQTYQRYFFIRDLQTNSATAQTFTFQVLGLTVAEAESALRKAAPTGFYGASQAILQATVAKKNKQRWGDKTPHQVRNIEELAKAYPTAQFVHVIRDGRDAAISIRKAGWLNGQMIAIARYWQQQVSAGVTAGRSLENSQQKYYEVYYEQLLKQPETVLKDLCDWLNLEYTPRMLEYYRDASSDIQPKHMNLFALNQKPLDASRAYAWKYQMSPADKADFEDIAGNLLQELGYELSGAKISFSTRLFRTIKDSLKSWLYKMKDKYKS